MEQSSSSSPVESNQAAPITSSSVSNVLNDLDPETSPSHILPKNPIGLLNVQDLQMLATANLIAQTQETIAQQFNITVDPPVEKQKKNKSQSPKKLLESGSRSSERKVKRAVSKLKSEDKAKRFCAEQVERNTDKEGTNNADADIKKEFQLPAGHFCTHCKEKFSTAAELKTHHRLHKPLECQHPGCNKKFTWPSHYKYHQLTHAGEKNFICDYEDCGQVFYTAQQLEVHQRTHNNNKPFTCSYCSRPFTTAGNLKNHMRCHTGERPFVCDYPQCGKRFAELSTLKKHKITHTGKKPYICEICQKSFTQSSSRSVHMKTHRAAAALMFYCEFCSQTFTQSSALREHIVSVHPEAESNIFREHLKTHHVADSVVKDVCSREATQTASLNNEASDSNGSTEVKEHDMSKDEKVVTEEELAAHIKVTVSDPNNRICIVMLPADHCL